VVVLLRHQIVYHAGTLLIGYAQGPDLMDAHAEMGHAIVCGEQL
jgi:hypothetical protein